MLIWLLKASSMLLCPTCADPYSLPPQKIWLYVLVTVVTWCERGSVLNQHTEWVCRISLWMLGTGRSYLGFFLRGWGLAARGGRHGTWFSLKKVTIKGCLDRGPLRPTSPIQPADKERSGRENTSDITGPHHTTVPLMSHSYCTHPRQSPHTGVYPGCSGGWGASGWRQRWRRMPASLPDLLAPTAHPAASGPVLWESKKFPLDFKS